MNLHFYRKKNSIRKGSYQPSSNLFMDFLVKSRIWINLEIDHKMSKYCIFWKAIYFYLYRIYNCAHIIKITKYFPIFISLLVGPYKKFVDNCEICLNRLKFNHFWGYTYRYYSIFYFILKFQYQTLSWILLQKCPAYFDIIFMLLYIFSGFGGKKY